jgi:hypothetical protein
MIKRDNVLSVVTVQMLFNKSRLESQPTRDGT